MRLTVMSFGFKFGMPPEADLVLDVRCLPNPFYVPELKHKTGTGSGSGGFCHGPPGSTGAAARYEKFFAVYALPLYVKEGKSQLTIAVGCTGGNTAHHICAEDRGVLHATGLSSPASSTVMPCAAQN